MSLLDEYSEFFNITWFTDDQGKKTSIKRTNEPHQIVKNKILLNEIPDSFYKVVINGMLEIPLSRVIDAEDKFKVNYLTGEVVFHESKNGQTINVTQYYGRGLIKSYAKRVILENTIANWDSENLEDLAREVTSRISNLESRVDNLFNGVTTDSELIDSHTSDSYGSYANLRQRLEAIEKREKYFAREVKTVPVGQNTISLTGTPLSAHKLLIYDTNYGCIWDEGIHWNRSGKVITFTEPSFPDPMTFVIYNLG